MRNSTAWFVFLLVILFCRPVRAVHHYVFVSHERDRIRETTFLDTKAFEGAQLKYTWRELEPSEDNYAFDSIRRDLSFLRQHYKHLFIQLQDSTFASNLVAVPQYLITGHRYHGGADKHYNIPNDDESRAIPCGWVARRWDPAVQQRFHRLLQALGKEFDGEIEGINLPETSFDVGESGRLYPKDFTPEVYRNAVLANLMALKMAFPKSVTMQYANFMPGEWLPGNNRGLLRSVYDQARTLKIGVGCPDLLPFKPGQMNHAYFFIPKFAGIVPIGVALQDGNYQYRNPNTGKQVTIPGFIDFATVNLKADYLFWCTQEPYYSRALIPFLESRN